MKYTILLDSSCAFLSVGLSNENGLLDSVSYEAWQAQSEHMVPELDNLLKKYNVKPNDILDVVVAIGPGSYTGVRIALTIAKTIATALKVNLYPVSSLWVLKDGTSPSVCLINARNGRSYIGVYEDSTCLLNDQIMDNEDVLKYLSAHPTYSVCGDTRYLGRESKKSNILLEMASLKRFLIKAPDPMLVKPVYLKS